MMRQRPPANGTGNNNNNNKHNGHDTNFSQANRKASGTKKSAAPPAAAPSKASFVVFLVLLVATIQLVIEDFLQDSPNPDPNVGSSSHLRGDSGNNLAAAPQRALNSYDVLLKNSISYESPNDATTTTATTANLTALQEQIHNLQSQIATLESKSQKYVDDPRFFPFVIRDSRHLTPIQIDPDFHVFDYVDLTQAKQPKSKHSQLLHNARVVVDDILEAKRANETAAHKTKKKRRVVSEKNEAPCQGYSIECYRQKILQVFSYVLRTFPSVEYYFYVEADNDLCVPMTMVKDLALTEKRYFINTGIGFSGWIMSRKFLGDFIELYGNSTLDTPDKPKAAAATPPPGKNNNTKAVASKEIRPDVLASYYLTDKMAWTVTRQYWVSHTTLESLGIASLSVKDRRTEDTGERMRLDKHLPRCLEPRRGKWKVSRRRPYLDPRDRFGWDYFDYDVCPNEVLFPCKGEDQLRELVEDDWRVANETGALAKWKQLEEKRKAKEQKEKLAAEQEKKLAVARAFQQELEAARAAREEAKKVQKQPKAGGGQR